MSLPETTSFVKLGPRKTAPIHSESRVVYSINLKFSGPQASPSTSNPSPPCPSLHYPRAPNPPFSVFFFFLKMRVKNNNTSLIPNSSQHFSPDPPHFTLCPLSPLNASLFSASHQIPPSSFLSGWGGGLHSQGSKL